MNEGWFFQSERLHENTHKNCRHQTCFLTTQHWNTSPSTVFIVWALQLLLTSTLHQKFTPDIAIRRNLVPDDFMLWSDAVMRRHSTSGSLSLSSSLSLSLSLALSLSLSSLSLSSLILWQTCCWRQGTITATANIYMPFQSHWVYDYVFVCEVLTGHIQRERFE